MEVGFSLGSNLGDRLRYLQWAKARLLLSQEAFFLGQSSVYETEPVGVSDPFKEMKFLNAVLIVESDLAAAEWLPKIKQIEEDLARVRTEDRNAPRTIDIDILFAGNEVVESDLLQVPHPRWAERRFVVEPLAEVRGDLVVPNAKCPVRKILAQMPPNDDVRLFTDRW